MDFSKRKTAIASTSNRPVRQPNANMSGSNLNQSTTSTNASNLVSVPGTIKAVSENLVVANPVDLTANNPFVIQRENQTTDITIFSTTDKSRLDAVNESTDEEFASYLDAKSMAVTDYAGGFRVDYKKMIRTGMNREMMLRVLYWFISPDKSAFNKVESDILVALIVAFGCVGGGNQAMDRLASEVEVEYANYAKLNNLPTLQELAAKADKGVSIFDADKLRAFFVGIALATQKKLADQGISFNIVLMNRTTRVVQMIAYIRSFFPKFNGKIRKMIAAGKIKKSGEYRDIDYTTINVASLLRLTVTLKVAYLVDNVDEAAADARRLLSTFDAPAYDDFDSTMDKDKETEDQESVIEANRVFNEKWGTPTGHRINPGSKVIILHVIEIWITWTAFDRKKFFSKFEDFGFSTADEMMYFWLLFSFAKCFVQMAESAYLSDNKAYKQILTVISTFIYYQGKGEIPTIEKVTDARALKVATENFMSDRSLSKGEAMEKLLQDIDVAKGTILSELKKEKSLVGLSA